MISTGGMAWRRAVQQILAWGVLSVVAALLHLHLQCLQERDRAQEDRFSGEFDPDTTDCDVMIPFVKSGRDRVETYLGAQYMQTMP